MKPEFITFTGLDARTDMSIVHGISNLYPVEWGVLFSPKRQGLEPRYPGMEVVDEIRKWSKDIRLAAHLCGRYAQRVQARMPLQLDLTGFKRAQVNCHEPDAGAISDFARDHNVAAIAQHRNLRFPEDERISWLYDKSGGNGLSPTAWPTCPEEGLYGYAGGMGPDNVVETLERINAKGSYWIDMESKIRTDDWLDLGKCLAVCEAVFD